MQPTQGGLAMTQPKKALVLSGGGGRGAYHIGVLEALVERGWMQDGQGPDIIAGTSIGAINAAALASGLTVAELKRHWLAMHTEEVHRLSSDLPPAARPLLRFMLRSVLTSEAHGGSHDTLPVEERSMSAAGLLNRLATLFHTMPFRSLLETTPWRRTLSDWMDFERINSPAAPALLLAATELQTGALRVFCNRELSGQPADTIVLDHLMASSSIPIVYPWTEIGSEKYWDGAVLANTPLEPVIDLAGDDNVDILVVTTRMQSNNPFDSNVHHWPYTESVQTRVRQTHLLYRTVSAAQIGTPIFRYRRDFGHCAFVD
jgi:NTE family protein